MKMRRRVVAFHVSRVLARAVLLGFVMVALVGLGASTCGDGSGVYIPCDESEDCHDYPGTQCTDEMCVCKTDGHRFCEWSCKPIAECWQDEASTGEVGGAGGAGSAGGAGGAGGMGGGAVECATAADCKQPGDPRCGTAMCTGGVCNLELKPLSKIASQRAGDCKEKWCDGQGNLIEYTEASDIYQDGLPCINNSCQAGNPVSMLVPNGDTCPMVGAGVCYEGECVPCVQGLADCKFGLVCDNTQCVAAHCTNNQWDPASGETGPNCGGACSPCFMGSPCNVGTDCLSGVCTKGACQPPTCSDGVRNDHETGADCGGPPNCARCPAGEGCKLPTDCLSGVCWTGVCHPPTCTDGVKNGDETGEDCGGSCAACL